MMKTVSCHRCGLSGQVPDSDFNSFDGATRGEPWRTLRWDFTPETLAYYEYTLCPECAKLVEDFISPPAATSGRAAAGAG